MSGNPRTRHARASASRARRCPPGRSASAIAHATSPGSRMAANGTNTTRVAPSSAIARASSNARRVFPTPPGPTIVMRRAAGSASHCRSVCMSASRPRRTVSGNGQRDARSVDRPPWLHRCPRALPGARHAPVRSGRAPRTARARSRHGAAVVPRARARSRHGPTGPKSSRALPACSPPFRGAP